MSPPLLTYARSTPRHAKEADHLVGHCAGHRRHRGDELLAVRPARRHHAPAPPARAHRTPPAPAERSSCSSPTSSARTSLKALPRALHGSVDGVALAVGADDEIDRPVLEVPAAVAEASARGAALTARGAGMRVSGPHPRAHDRGEPRTFPGSPMRAMLRVSPSRHARASPCQPTGHGFSPSHPTTRTRSLSMTLADAPHAVHVSTERPIVRERAW